MTNVAIDALYLSRLILNPRDRHVRRDLADPVQLHRTILRAFPPGPAGNPAFRQGHGVLYRLDPDGTGRPVVLVQSASPPDWSFLGKPGEYLLRPPESKPIGDLLGALAEGHVLRFRLRANPTRKIDTKSGEDGRRRNGRRIALRKPDELSIWLRRKAVAGGFALLPLEGTYPESGPFDLRIDPEPDAVGRARAVRARDGDDDVIAPPLTFGAARFEGRLRITDRQAFLRTVTQGLGSAKAFGFGLLSLTRP